MEHISSVQKLENILCQKLIDPHGQSHYYMKDIVAFLSNKNMCLVFDDCDTFFQ